MSAQAENVSVTVAGGSEKVEATFLGTGLSSDSSAGAHSNNNVSFVNINYTIQPKPFLARFKEIPSKKILDNVR